MEPDIVFEDESLMIINKPSGWITNSANTTTEQPVVQDWLAKNFNFPVFENIEQRNGIVHRLDKETSGVLLIAKTKEAFENLQAQFKNREVKKKYIALVHGEVEQKEGKIDITVGRLPWKRDRFGVLPGGRESVTEYKVLEHYMAKIEDGGMKIDNEDGGSNIEVRNQASNFKHQTSLSKFNPQSSIFSLVELSPKTGRTHQIRIHMKFLGHPIVSDEFYAGRKTARKERKWCPRLFLHAAQIEFTHPKSGKRQKFEAKLPLDLETALKTLEMVREKP